MFKKIFGLLFAWTLLWFPLSIAAASGRVVDGADLFSSAEEAALEKKAQELSDQYGTDVFILTDYQTGFSSNFARDYLEQYGESNYPDGYVAYMINMADRSYWVDAYGSDERAVFTQRVTDELSDIAYDQLRNGSYYGSAMAVLNEVGNQYELSTPMGWLKKPLLYPGKALLFTLGSGAAALAVAGIATAVKTSRHKDKSEVGHAAQYGSGFVLTGSDNRFVRHYQTRMPKPKPQPSRGGGGGGGGGGHTGSGGHF